MNFLALNCSSSPAVSSLLGVCNCPARMPCGCRRRRRGAVCRGTGSRCGQSTACTRVRRFCSCLGSSDSKRSGAGRICRSRAHRARKPTSPRPAAVPGALSEERAADGAAECPVPTGWGQLWEDVTPRAGGLEAAAELPTAGALPDETLGFARTSGQHRCCCWLESLQ